jgi:hypothetical protein
LQVAAGSALAMVERDLAGGSTTAALRWALDAGDLPALLKTIAWARTHPATGGALEALKNEATAWAKHRSCRDACGAEAEASEARTALHNASAPAAVDEATTSREGRARNEAGAEHPTDRHGADGREVRVTTTRVGPFHPERVS